MSGSEEKIVVGCDPTVHGKHMCQLMKEEFYLKSPAEFKALVQDAQYRCDNCGRTVKDAVNVCAPVVL